MDQPVPLPENLLDRFAAIVGPAHAIRNAADMEPFTVEPRDKFVGSTQMVLRPGSVAEVAAILKLASETKTAIVPQGGNTGLVGGQIPDRGGELILSLQRLKAVRVVDPSGGTMTVEAGVTLAEAQAAAESADRLYPLSLASEGSCTVGGNLSTNAGGTAVLAYGNARELCLGVEVVLASGEVWNGLRKLRKDNTGYDLRDLFIGAEGTLGIITAAVLKLFPRPRGRSLAFVAVKSPREALALFNLARGLAGSNLVTFELLPRIGIDFVLKHAAGTRDPLSTRHDWYALFEVISLQGQDEAEAAVEAIFEAAFGKNLVEDGIRAESLDQAAQIWKLRHMMSEVQKLEGGSIKHDVAVPVAAVPELLERAAAAVTARIPGARPCMFGHMGDGNIHLNVSQPADGDKQAFLVHWDEVNEIVFEIVLDLGGTISAEHGIGVLKREKLKQVKSPLEIALMRKIKATLDPNGILNPGKVL
jgi:FAD/FMN-containing dehydrogenase